MNHLNGTIMNSCDDVLFIDAYGDVWYNTTCALGDSNPNLTLLNSVTGEMTTATRIESDY